MLAVPMADTLAIGTALIDTLGAAFAVDVSAHWQPDDLFFEVCRDREAIGAMLAEVANPTTVKVSGTPPCRRRRSMHRTCLSIY